MLFLALCVFCFSSGVSALQMTFVYLLEPCYRFDLSISNADLNERINIGFRDRNVLAINIKKDVIADPFIKNS